MQISTNTVAKTHSNQIESREGNLLYKIGVQFKMQGPSVAVVGRKNSINTEDHFGNLFVDNSNEIAVHKAKTMLAVNGLRLVNPFVIHGEEGTGKTHLAMAIVNEIQKKTAKRIKLVNEESFNQMMDAYTYVHFSELSVGSQLDNIEFLFIDDAHQVLQTKEQVGFMKKLLDYLIKKEIQVLLTYTGPIEKLKELPGLTVHHVTSMKYAPMDYPKAIVRMRIVNRKQLQSNHILPIQVAEYISYHTFGNIRELEGAITTLLAIQKFYGRKVTLQDAMKLMNKVVVDKNQHKHLHADFIMKTVARYFHLSIGDLLKVTRKRKIVQARQLAMYFTKTFTALTYAHIGKLYGGNSHATVLHACKTVKNLHENNIVFRSYVTEIKELLAVV